MGYAVGGVSGTTGGAAALRSMMCEMSKDLDVTFNRHTMVTSSRHEGTCCKGWNSHIFTHNPHRTIATLPVTRKLQREHSRIGVYLLLQVWTPRPTGMRHHHPLECRLPDASNCPPHRPIRIYHEHQRVGKHDLVALWGLSKGVVSDGPQKGSSGIVQATEDFNEDSSGSSESSEEQMELICEYTSVRMMKRPIVTLAHASNAICDGFCDIQTVEGSIAPNFPQRASSAPSLPIHVSLPSCRPNENLHFSALSFCYTTLESWKSKSACLLTRARLTWNFQTKMMKFAK